MRHTGTNRERSVYHDGTHDYPWVKVFDPRCRRHVLGSQHSPGPTLRHPWADRIGAVLGARGGTGLDAWLYATRLTSSQDGLGKDTPYAGCALGYDYGRIVT
jgi:hypothetical protein